MNEKQLKEFLGFNCSKDLIGENKLLTWLYAIFTILFLDVHIWVTSLYEINPGICFSIIIVLTLLIVVLALLNFYSKRSSAFQLYIIQGVVLALNATVWFCILVLRSLDGSVQLNKGHLITASIMLLIWIGAIAYRAYRLHKKRPKKSKNVIYIGGFSVGLVIMFILRRGLDNFENDITNLVLSHGCIILGVIFLMISTMVLFNAFVAKKYRFMISE